MKNGKIKLWMFSVVYLMFVMAGGLHAAYPFSDDFESGTGSWSLSGLWGETTFNSYSLTHAVTDSPGRFYTNNTDNAVTLASSVDISLATNPVIRFYHKYALESGYDTASVEVSTDGGMSWITPGLETYTGNLGHWTREQLSLDSYIGQSDLRIRFRIVTDGSIVQDGWYLDDVRIAEALMFDGITSITSSSPTCVELAWTPATDGTVSGYRIYRGLSTNLDWRSGHIVAELGNTATNYTDISVSPKTTYFYKVMVLDDHETHALSSMQSVTTPAGMDYPFLDNAEGGGAMWMADAPWVISSEDAASPVHAWSDSPGTNYDDSVNVALTLVSSMDLSTAVAPAFCFVHKYDFSSGDSGNAEVSINGADWTSLEQFTGTSGGVWKQTRYDLSAYVGEFSVFVRLRLTSDHAAVADGWHIDDIAVSESPDIVNAPLISDVQSHSMRLTWVASTNEQFSYYAIFQSSVSGVDFNDTLATTITERATATCVVSDLALDSDYYFRVYAVNNYGIYSADGTENHAHTLNHPVPFIEGFEGSIEGWNITGTWGTETNNVHTGQNCFSDSPNNATYPISSYAQAQTAVDLRGTTWPVLRFWDRFDLGAGDSVGLEISSDGVGWSRVYGMRAGSRSDWREQIADLSPWKGQANVRIRFWRSSDGDAAVGDGWFVDDVTVAEHVPLSIAYPYYDGFEDGVSNWLHTGWAIATNESHTGTASAQASDTESIPGEYYDVTSHQLNLAGPLDLSGATNPQLTLWVKGHLYTRSYFRIHVSTDGGVHWTERAEANFNSDVNFDWTRVQCDLSSYAGQSIRLRLQVHGYRYNPTCRIWLDGLAIEDRPADALLHSPTPYLKSADLSWDVSTLGSAFKRYELHRDINPTVTLADPVIFSSTNVAATNFTDVGLSIGQTYYYRLFVVNTNDAYSLGSERQITTVPLNIGFTDPMENLDQWDVTGDWGPDSSSPHSGSNCLSDTPGGLYQPSTSGHITTAVDLQGTTWPVLRFWDRFDLGAGDSVGLEISSDGVGWSRVYGMRAGSRSDWREQIADLSPWKGQANVRIRFWRSSDGDAAVGDGWFVDDVTVAEHVPLSIAYPYYDGFEDGVSNWLHTGWAIATNESHTGTASAQASDTESIPGEYYDVTSHQLNLAGPLDLSGATNPQLTLWVKGHLYTRSYFRIHVSTDGGVHWTERAEANFNSDVNFDWTRVQCDLSSYAGQSIRLRLQVHGYRYNPTCRIWLDGLAIEDRPADALLHSPTPYLKSADLSWDVSTLGSAFKRYELHRDINPTVTLADPVIFSSTNVAATNFTDVGLSIGQTYYYRLFVVNTNDAYSLGSERQITTVPLNIGFTDPMENLDQWDVTGDWGPDSSSPHSGSNCLSDTPGGLYQPSTSGNIQLSVNLIGSTWPVLRFWDRYDLGIGDSVGLEISPDGASWTRLYGLRIGNRSDWHEQIVDLTAWKNQPNVRIRFWRFSDGDASVGDGWFIDDVSVMEHTPAAIAYPFYEDFENGLSNWLYAGWLLTTNTVYDGAASLIDCDAQTIPGGYYDATHHQLTLAAPLVLTNAVNPKLAFWIKGHLYARSHFRIYVSTDAGASWTERSEANFNYEANFDWTRVQCDLTEYVSQTIRVRFQVWGYRYNPDTDIYLDNIGIGEPAPGAPTLHSPANIESVPVRRPTLRVKNAIDFQGDALNYKFEIYSDVMHSNLVASVPVVAQGDETTAWVVDTDLSDAQYWWRCRASDAVTNGSWMDTATFYVNHVNNAPLPIMLVGPPSASILHDLSHVLVWRPTSDPDTGGIVANYHLQIAPSSDYTNLVVDDAFITVGEAPTGSQWTVSMPLSAFNGTDDLLENTYYFWRMRADDQWGAWSTWSTNNLWFIFGTPPPTVNGFELEDDGSVTMDWERSGTAVYVEYKADLMSTDEWEVVDGPVYGTNTVITPLEGKESGFYRVITE